MNLEFFKNFILGLIDKIKTKISKLFVEASNEPKLVRKKHIRLGILLLAAFLAVCFGIIESGDKKTITKTATEKITPNFSGVKELVKGVTNEQTWAEIRGKEVDEIRSKQLESDAKQSEIESVLEKDKISRDEVSKLISDLRSEIQESYSQKLEDEIAKIKAENEKKIPDSLLETKVIKPKKVIRKIGEYIPANSYVQAKLISGVDAGVGISSEANPRQTLLRVTGEAISAGIGENYLKTNRLIGCLLSAKAIGDISSEKAYLDGVLLTCAVDKQTAIEVPVKAYVTSHAKSGIRGEVVSREGDMVLKSFLSGLASGFGSSIQQMSQPQMSITGSGFTTNAQKTRDIFKSGLGSGTSSGSDTLSQYFIKRAEQYQPVISIDEGVEVYVVFQEGFSLKDEENKNEKTS